MNRSHIRLLLSGVAIISLVSCNNADNSSRSEKAKDSISKEKKIILTNSEIKNLNQFFTCFSEIHLPSFSGDNVPDSILIQFGVYYNYRKHFEMFKQITEASRASISEIPVIDTAFKFFGFKINKHQSIEGIEYKNKNYIIPNSDGEVYRFSQVRELIEANKGIFNAIVEIYSASSGFTGDINSDPDSWKTVLESDEIPKSEGKINAKIRKVEEQGRIRYILLEYLN